MADLPRGFRTTQNLKRFPYGPQPVSAPAIAYSGTWAPLNSPHFTGDPQAPTPPTPDNDTSIATTAFVKNQNYAPLASPTFTGDPKAPTASPGDADTSIATTAFVGAAVTAAPNKTITLSGDVAGSGTAAIVTTLPTVNGNIGTFQGLTVNAKGQVTAAANQGYPTTPVSVANGGTGDTGTAWASYTPTITAGTGTFTTVSATGRFKAIGKTYFIQISVTITTNGTAAQSVNATLPAGLTAAAAGILHGRELLVNGAALCGTVTAGSGTVFITRYDNAYPGVTGGNLVVSGVFEIA